MPEISVEQNVIAVVHDFSQFKEYEEHYHQLGYKVKTMNSISPMQGNTVFDPLKLVNGHSDTKGIAIIADTIIGSNPVFENRDFAIAAKSLLMAEIIFHKWIQREKRIPGCGSMEGVLYLQRDLAGVHSFSDFQSGNWFVADRFQSVNWHTPAYPYWKTYFSCSDFLQCSIYTSVNLSLELMYNEEYIQALQNRPKFQMKQFVKEQSVALLYAPEEDEFAGKQAELLCSLAMHNMSLLKEKSNKTRSTQLVI